MENVGLVRQKKKIAKIMAMPLLLSAALLAIGTYVANDNLRHLGGIFFLMIAGIYSIITGYYALFKKVNPLSTDFFPLLGFDSLPNAVIILLGLLFASLGFLVAGFGMLGLIKLIMLHM